MRMLARDEDVPTPVGLGPIAPQLLGGLAALCAATLILYGVAETPLRAAGEIAGLAAFAAHGLSLWTLRRPQKSLVGPLWLALEGLMLGVLAALVLPALSGTAFLSATIGWFALAALAGAQGVRSWAALGALLAPVGLGALWAAWTSGGGDLVSIIALAGGALAAIAFAGMLQRRAEAGAAARRDAGWQRELAATALLLEEAGDCPERWLWELDAAGVLVDASIGFTAATGLKADLFGALRFVDFLAELDTGPAAQLARIRAAIAREAPFGDIDIRLAVGGGERWWRLSGTPLRAADGALTGYLGATIDRTEVLRTDRDLEAVAHADAVTRLLNRGQFAFESERLAERFDRHGAGFALLLLELDGLAGLAADEGGMLADAVLAEAGVRIADALRDTDLAARLEGGRFGILLTGLVRREEVEMIAARLAKALTRPIVVHGEPHRLGASFGLAVAGPDGSRPAALLRAAELALDRARVAGRGGLKLIAADAPAEAAAREAMVADLAGAFRRGGLELAFHPMIDATHGLPLALLAQPRWHHPQRGLLLPSDFVPVADAVGAAPALGDWMIETAAGIAAALPEIGPFAIDVAPRHLLAGDLAQATLAALRLHDIAGARLEFVFGAAALDALGPDFARRLGELRRLGVRLSMSEYGAGTATVERLIEFPFDRVVLGRPFIARLASDIATRRALRVLSPLPIEVLAEGLGTAEQVGAFAEIAGRPVRGVTLEAPLAAIDLIGAATAPAKVPVRRRRAQPLRARRAA